MMEIIGQSIFKSILYIFTSSLFKRPQRDTPGMSLGPVDTETAA